MTTVHRLPRPLKARLEANLKLQALAFCPRRPPGPPAIDDTAPMQDITTWAALLGRWMDLARAARALDGHDNGPWQRALPSIITYEALAQALPHLGDLPIRERSLALDQAQVLLEARRADMEDAFEDLPQVVEEAELAAEAAIEQSRGSFVWTILWEGPGPLAMPAISGAPASSTEGAVAMMLPGTLALPGEPVAWWVGRNEPMLGCGVAGCQAVPLDEPLQVWRKFDQQGGAIEDRVRSVNDDGPAGGLPLLVPRVAGGECLPAPDVPSDWPPANPDSLPRATPVHWDVEGDLFSGSPA